MSAMQLRMGHVSVLLRDRSTKGAPSRAKPFAAYASADQQGVRGMTLRTHDRQFITKAGARVQAVASLESLESVALHALKEGRFVLEKDEVDELVRSSGLDEEHLLLALNQPAKQLARPPISSFPVGAVALGASGKAYLGVNMEFPGVPLSQSVHAEQFAVAIARRADERNLVAIAATAAPCGHCRQFLQELQGAEKLRTVMPGMHETEMEHLLPHSFGPDDLLPPGTHAFLLSQRHNFLKRTEESKERMWGSAAHAAGGNGAAANGNGNGAAGAPSSASIELAHRAFAACQGSYAPYSECPSGVALMTKQGTMHAGGVLESAAYNPTLPPLQCALVAAAADGVASWADIVEAVLVERKDAKVSQAGMTKLLLSQIAPGAKLTVLHAEEVLPPKKKA